MSYQKRLDTEAVVRLKDNAIIGPENKEEWAEYQNWLSKGNKPKSANKPVKIKTPNPPTAEEKLASLGLTKDDLKELLGL